MFGLFSNSKTKDEMKPQNILITTAGGIEKHELVMNLLEEQYSEWVGNVVAVDAVENVLTHQYSSVGTNGRLTFEKVPFASDSQYLQSLNSICNYHGIDIIFSIDTDESILLSKYAKDYNYLKKVKLTCSDGLDENIHLNKMDYFRVLGDNGCDFVGPFQLISETSAYRKQQVFDKFTKIYPTIQKYVLKPNNSHGSRGLKIVDILFNYDDYSNSRDPYFISGREAVEMFATSRCEFFVQPFYRGQNYNVDCYKSTYGIIHMSVQKIIGNRWGQVLGAEILTMRDPEYQRIMEIGNKISEFLNLNKNFNFEVSFCPELDKLMLVEVNPRISAVFPQSMLTQTNLPLISIKDAVGELHDDHTTITLHEKIFLSSVLKTVKSNEVI